MTTHSLLARTWSIVGASVTGTGHLSRQLPCQDAFRVWYRPAGPAVIAVADGAGSASHSNIGSSEAAELAVGAMRAHFLRQPSARPNIYEALEQSFATVRKELELYAARRNVPLASLATTLTVAVLMDDCLTVAQTGDGLSVGVNDLGELKAYTTPQSGEYANETYFITGPSGTSPRFVEVYAPVVSALAVLTDGLLSVAADFKRHQPHRGFFEPMFRALTKSNDMDKLQEQLAAFLGSARMDSQTDDDKTLVLAVRRNSMLELELKL